MSTEDNKALVRYWIEEVINKGNLAVVDALCPPGYVGHNPHHPLKDQPVGPEEVKEHVVKWLHAVFPDLHQDIEEMIAEGDKVVVRSTFRGTHQGTFAGIAPTGKRLHMTAIEIFRVQDGKLPEHWINADYLGAMQQLGVLPTPETAPTENLATAS
jgi:predicted ester cyclase